MTAADCERLVRLLGMTGSDSDGEALTAIRMAGKLLADLKLTWADVISLSPAPRSIHRVVDEAWTVATETDSANRKTSEDFFAAERLAVTTARARLDAVLLRKQLDDRQRPHFEAIREHHRTTGHINPSHRAQIDRQFFKSGWDSPLGGQAVPNAMTAERLKKLFDEN